MNLYLVRHGLSEGNIANIHQSSETQLSEKGLEQAKAVAKRFAGVHLDVIYSSPMKRALQTATQISIANGQPIVQDSLLSEMLTPSKVVGLYHDSPEARLVMDQIDANFHDQSFRHSDEETFWDLKERVTAFMGRLTKARHSNVLAVTHGLVLRMFVGLTVFGKDLTSHEFVKLYDNLKTINTGVTKCVYGDDGVWKLITWNDHSHWVE